MAHEHLTYDACTTCLTFGIVVRTTFSGTTMHLSSEPCPACEGLGFRRDTGQVVLVPDEDDDDELDGTMSDPEAPREGTGPPADDHPVWKDPAVEVLPGCHVCLGAGMVTHLPEASGILVIAPCPACQAQGDMDRE